MTEVTDAAIAELNELGYLIHNLYQAHYGGWEITFRSPYGFHHHHMRGSTIAEAATNALLKARKLGPALSAPRPVYKQRQRVRLRKRRVRLRS